MPVDSEGVGYSDHTSDKQRLFRGIVSVWLKMAYGAATKFGYFNRPNRIYYFDLNAGPGWHREYGHGSPMIFCQLAEQLKMVYPEFRYSALMVDQSADNVNALRRQLDDASYYHAAATHDDNAVVLGQYAKSIYRNAFGLFYFDPTTPSDMPWEQIVAISRTWRSADILLHIPAASFKRVQNRWGNPSLLDSLHAIDKRNKSIMKPVGKHQWTFIYLTNGPTIKWPSVRFYDVDSAEGRATFDLITMTTQQRKDRDNDSQPSLF